MARARWKDTAEARLEGTAAHRLGERIRTLRLAREMTQAELGGGKLTKSFISLLESGRAHPSLHTLKYLAGRLGTSLLGLLGEEEDLAIGTLEGLLALAKEEIRQRRPGNALTLMAAGIHLAAPRPLHLVEARLVEGAAHIEERNFGAAGETLRLALEEATRLGHAGQRASALYLLGRTELWQRRLPEARTMFESAIETARQDRYRDATTIISALYSLGTTQVYMGHYDDALASYAEAVELAETARKESELGLALWGIGWVHARLENFPQALRYHEQARGLLERAEDLWNLGRVYKDMAIILIKQGKPREAIEPLERSLKVATQLGDRMSRAYCLTELARAHFLCRDLAEARRFAELAVQAAVELGDPGEHGRAKVVLARVLEASGGREEAVRLFRDAIEVFTRSHHLPELAEAAETLGLLYRQQGKHADAAAYLAMAIDATQVSRSRKSAWEASGMEFAHGLPGPSAQQSAGAPSTEGSTERGGARAATSRRR